MVVDCNIMTGVVTVVGSIIKVEKFGKQAKEADEKEKAEKEKAEKEKAEKEKTEQEKTEQERKQKHMRK
eukprot:7425739-Ditylum_brightwellii.AAC.1